MNSRVEYDPERNMIREGGEERNAGFSALGFISELNRVQNESQVEDSAESLESKNTATSQELAKTLQAEKTNDSKNGAQGEAPHIQLAAGAAENPWKYTGPAAFNPYFCDPTHPLVAGKVTDFEGWFVDGKVTNAVDGSTQDLNRTQMASDAGAKEALRLVQQYAPDATLSSERLGEAGGPFVANQSVAEIRLSGGEKLNAGAILNSYYNGGEGVTAGSDRWLSDTVLDA